MKEKLHGAFKTTPQRFLYTIESSVNEAVMDGSRSKKSRKYAKIILAVFLLVAIIPTAVFGAVRLFGVKPEKVGKFGVGFSVSKNQNASEYIKMKISLPDAFYEVENSARLKFRRTANDEHAFTILPMKIIDDRDLATIEPDVSSIEEMQIASHKAYKLIGTKDYGGLDRYYICYEDYNMIVLIYRGKTITDSELEDFVNGITFVKGTKEDHDSFYELNGEDQDAMDVDYNFEYKFLLTDKDTEFVFTGYDKETGKDGYQVKSKITDIRVESDAKGISKVDVNNVYDYDKAIGENGRLYPRVTELWQNGDGIDTERKLISTSYVNQKLVLADIYFTNTTDKELNIYIPYRLETLRKVADGVYDFATTFDRYNDIFANSYCDGEIFYMSEHGISEKDYYTITMLPNESKTITLGFRCNEDQVDNAYIVFSAITDGVISPQINTDNQYTCYIFKVN